jgi:uncharacterized low-complexity protein
LAFLPKKIQPYILVHYENDMGKFTKLMSISALAAGIVLVGAMTVINNANLALAEESQEKVCEKHQRVEGKHGFGSKQDHNFHEKHGYPENEVLGDLSGQEGDKDSLSQNC